MDWVEAAQIAQVFAVPVTTAGILVSLAIGITTLREMKAERVHRVRPLLRFDVGGRRIPVALSDSGYLLGIDPNFALKSTTRRPIGKNRLDATALWDGLKNYGQGTAFDVSITFLYYRVFISNDCFVIDEVKRDTFPYQSSVNIIPASPSHLPPGHSGHFMRLPTPIVVDYNRTINRMDGVVLIEYSDSFKTKYSTRQGVTIWTDLVNINKGEITITFHEELSDRRVDHTLFGLPETPPMLL
jgi:hypothetical protein